MFSISLAFFGRYSSSPLSLPGSVTLSPPSVKSADSRESPSPSSISLPPNNYRNPRRGERDGGARPPPRLSRARGGQFLRERGCSATDAPTVLFPPAANCPKPRRNSKREQPFFTRLVAFYRTGRSDNPRGSQKKARIKLRQF